MKDHVTEGLGAQGRDIENFAYLEYGHHLKVAIFVG